MRKIPAAARAAVSLNRSRPPHRSLQSFYLDRPLKLCLLLPPPVMLPVIFLLLYKSTSSSASDSPTPPFAITPIFTALHQTIGNHIFHPMNHPPGFQRQIPGRPTRDYRAGKKIQCRASRRRRAGRKRLETPKKHGSARLSNSDLPHGIRHIVWKQLGSRTSVNASMRYGAVRSKSLVGAELIHLPHWVKAVLRVRQR